ncbi:unnamed protein product, partial [Coregonus sp. 'balchen']
MEGGEVLLNANSDKSLTDAEQMVKTALSIQSLVVENQDVLKMPGWKDLNSHLVDAYNFPKKNTVRIIVSGFLDPVKEVSNCLEDFVEKYSQVEEAVCVKSCAVVKFIQEKKSQNCRHFAKRDEVNVCFVPRRPRIFLSGSRLYVKKAKASFQKMAAAFCTDELTIMKPGARKYFQEQESMFTSMAMKEHGCVALLQEDHMLEIECVSAMSQPPRGREGVEENIFTKIKDVFKGPSNGISGSENFVMEGEEFSPTRGPQALSRTQDWVENLIVKEQTERTIKDPYVSQLSQGDVVRLQAMQRELTGPDSLIHLEGLSFDVLTADRSIRDMVRSVETEDLRLKETFRRIQKQSKIFGRQIELFGKELIGSLPTQWDDMNGSLLKLVNLTPRSREYDDVERECVETGLTHTIIKIERVQNKALWKNYQIKKKDLEEKNKHYNNERLLFHGTSSNSISQINNHGFNCSYIETPGIRMGRFGNGKSISPGLGNGKSISPGLGNGKSISSGLGNGKSISPGLGNGKSISPGLGNGKSISPGLGNGKSISPGLGNGKSISPGLGNGKSISPGGYAKPDAQGLKGMYLARVLVGDYTQGPPGLLIPPAKPSGKRQQIEPPIQPFFDVQAYPEFLITFRWIPAPQYYWSLEVVQKEETLQERKISGDRATH